MIRKGIIAFILINLLILSGWESNAQDHEQKDIPNHSGSMHRFTLVMANALVNNSFTHETGNVLIVPVFGLNYDYFINPKWGLGLHGDILLQQFKVEKHSTTEEIVRENPIAICPVVLFKPNHKWTLLAGYGLEIEKNENIQLIRAGVEYGLELSKHWELVFMVELDYKINNYTNLVFGLGFSRMFGKRN